MSIISPGSRRAKDIVAGLTARPQTPFGVHELKLSKFPISEATGLPVIATRIPGNTELVDTEFGRLVAPGDAQQLALALLEMIEDPASLRRMESSESSFSRKYDWSIIAARIAKLFESCL